MEQVGTVKKYRDGSWAVWIEEQTHLVNVYIQRMGYFCVEFVASIPKPEEFSAESPGMMAYIQSTLPSAKERYKAKWLDDDDEI